MKELIEIIFEDVEKHALISFVTELSDYGRAVKDYHLLSECGENVKTDWHDYGSVLNTIEKITGGSLFVNLVSLDMGEITLSGCALRVIQYDDRFDLEISFDSESAPLYEYMAPRFALEMAERYHVENFYGGIEPAADEETRLFTRDKPGPLFPGQTKPAETHADDMPATTIIAPETFSVIREGWKILVAGLGVRKATEFVMLLERGSLINAEDRNTGRLKPATGERM